MALAAATCVAAASLAPAGAAAEGTTPALPQVPALPDAAALTTDAAALSSAVVELAESALPALPAAPAHVPSVEAASEPAAVTPAIQPQTPDITPEAPDTAGGVVAPIQPVLPDKPPAAVVSAAQVQPVNVNVSVRVASPGDDGTVTQINANLTSVSLGSANAAGASGSAAAIADTTQPPSSPTQRTAAAGSPADLLDDSLPVQPVPVQPISAQPDTWIWIWNCRDSSIGLPSLASMFNRVLPSNWNWNWSCGEENTNNVNISGELPNQYQVSATQYQPVNLNVSVRIASPGENGPIVQANLAASVATSVVAVSSSASSSSGLSPPPTSPASAVLSLSVVSVEVASGPAIAAPVAALPAAAVETVSALAALAAELAGDREVILDELDEILRGVTFGTQRGAASWLAAHHERRIPDRRATASVSRSVSAIPLPVALLGVWTPELPGLRRFPGSTDLHGVRELRGATSRSATSKHRPRAPLPPPAPLPSVPERVPLAALSLGGAAPGAGGDSGFLFLLLIPFAFALADVARRVSRDRPAIRAQVDSSRRERPG